MCDVGDFLDNFFGQVISQNAGHCWIDREESSLRCGLENSFDESARARLLERAQAERMTMPDLCAHLFKDYQFGLSLIQKNTGQKYFVLSRAAVDAPDKFLSDLVVQSHYPLAPAEKN